MAGHPIPIAPYPVLVEGRLERPSRGLWLVKWLLALPHYLVLAFLWLAFFVCAVVAFAAVLFTGRYPRSLFDFNLGVLRWSWRVGFYAYRANGTDRYPPFTLADVADYPARLAVAYPERQRRGLALLGWWLAGIPQYLIAGIFVGGGGAIGWSAGTRAWGGFSGFGLIGLLVLVAVLVLLFRGTYPRSIFDLVLGLDRWVVRVVCYAAVMTPEYPPFRLDPGELDPAGALTVSSPSGPAVALSGERDEAAVAGARGERAWSAGRVIAVVAASLALVVALAAIVGGGTALVFDQSERDAQGYLMTDSEPYSAPGYALVSDTYTAGTAAELSIGRSILGRVRIVTHSSRPIFVGIAPASEARGYLAGVERSEATRFGQSSSDFALRAGRAPSAPPTARRFWVASSVGAGSQTLTWEPSRGSWRIVVMNADAGRGVSTELAIGARFPHLLRIALVALGTGVILLLLGGAGLYLAVRKPRRPD
jgi:Domain of unknown function (DUF4389)